MRPFEQLEPKLLLAADLCHDDVEEQSAELATAETSVAATAFVARDAGSTIGTAQDLGTLGATKTFAGSVGGSDPNDVMRFSLAQRSTVTLGLGGLVRDIDLHLYDGAGRQLSVSNKAGAASESITASLDAGTYYIGVTPWRSAYSTYVLSAGAVAIAQPPVSPNPPATPATSFPDVAYFGGTNEWNVNAINAPESWARGYTGAGAVVAVVDTGVDWDHPDLVSQIWVNADEIAGNGVDDDRNGFIDDIRGWDFSSGDNNPDDGNGHGTHVAGTIAADNNGFGATGIAPDAQIMPVRVLANNGSGTSSGVAAGIRYAVQNGADIINLSLGGGYSSVILAAIQYALQSNVLVVAAAGNESAATPGYPAAFSASLANVLSVGAYSSAGAIASFSNDVGTSGAVQVDAPGVSVYSTYMGGGYARLSGTSMATPHVAGLAALALSANPNLTAAQLRALIVDGANRAIIGSDSHGGVNAALTVAQAAGGQGATTSTVSAAQSSVASQLVAARRILFSSIGDGGSPMPVFNSQIGQVPAVESSTQGAAIAYATAESVPVRVVRDLALTAMDAVDEIGIGGDNAESDSLVDAQSRARLFDGGGDEFDTPLWLLG
jgi:subtilisin family serine protease